MSKFTEKDWDDFVNFIAYKSKDVTAPFNLEDLCSEYKETSGTTHSEELLMTKIRVIRLRIHKCPYFDNDTKVKILFGLSAPVDYSFLEELEKKADLEVDKYLRITKYKKKRGSGLRLSGAHSSQAPLFINDKCEKMLKFLSEISKNKKSPIEYEYFAEEFERLTDYQLDEDDEENYYFFIKRNIHIVTKYDMPTRIKMLFVSGARVNPFFLKMIRKDAVVEVVEFGRIKEYKANDGSLMLRRDDDNDNTETESTDEMTSSKDILKQLRIMILVLKSSMLMDLQQKIEKAIEDFGDEDKTVPLDPILNALDVGLTIWTENVTSSKPSQEDSTSLNEFLMSLRCALFSLSKTQEIDELQMKIKEIKKEIGAKDKVVSIQRIRLVLETVFALIT